MEKRKDVAGVRVFRKEEMTKMEGEVGCGISVQAGKKTWKVPLLFSVPRV